jgi:hypothetical protein
VVNNNSLGSRLRDVAEKGIDYWLNFVAAFETKICESAATTSAHHLPARKGARVLAHGLPLPKPETVILANQNNFSIFHGIFSI